MRYMNEMDIQWMVESRRHHPVLGPATRTLANFQKEVDAYSDGWPYCSPALRAAKKLMGLIEGDGTWDAKYGGREVSQCELVAACRPIKSFCTRHKLEYRQG